MPAAIPGYNYVRYLGRGCWGQVHLYEQGSTSALYACKFFDPDPIAQAQMAERGWTEDDVWRKECLGGNTRSLPGLAYGSLEQLPDGTRFFRREYVDRILSDIITEKDGKRIPLEEIILVSQGIGAGLQSIHVALRRVYGDLKPENVAFTTVGDVKLMDFGAATVGESPRKYGGELFTRAPERFGTDSQKLNTSCDVWGAGAILYRMLTGSYPLEQELHDVHHPEEIVRALYTSSASWNQRVAEKVDRVVPRAFRPLLYKSLCDENERLKDGKSFSDELEKAVRRYRRSTPRARLIQVAAGLTTLGLLAGIGSYVIHVHAEQDTLREQNAKAERALSLEKKTHIVRLYMAGVRFPSDYNELSETGKLQGWIDIFGDKKTAVTAYFDKDTAARAIFEAGGKTDFQSIEDILLRIDVGLLGSVHNATSDAVDGWMWRVRGEGKDNIIREWRMAANDLTGRCNSLVEEYHVLEKEIAKHTKDESHAAGMASDIISEKRKKATQRQDEIIETLASLSGKSGVAIDGFLEDPSFRFSMPPLQKPPRSKPELGSPQSGQGE